MRENDRPLMTSDGGKPTAQTKSVHFLLPILLGSFMCVALFATCTWAWFQMTLTNSNNTIQAAVFSVGVTEGEAPLASGVTLDPGSHAITLTRTPDDGTTGYVKVTIGDRMYYYQFSKDTAGTYDFTVTVDAGASATLTYECGWGTYNSLDQTVIPPEVIISPTSQLMAVPPAEELPLSSPTLAATPTVIPEGTPAETPSEGTLPSDETTGEGTVPPAETPGEGTVVPLAETPAEE